MAVIELRGIDRPVGLFGLVRKMMRVLGPIASSHPLQRKEEVRHRRDVDDPRAEGVGARGVHVERGLDDDRLEGIVGRRPAQAHQRCQHDPVVQPIGEHDVVDADVEEARGRGDDRVVVGVDGGVLARQLAEHASDAGRAAGGVLVEVEAEAAVLRLAGARTGGSSRSALRGQTRLPVGWLPV